jgi:hypothetical protein
MLYCCSIFLFVFIGGMWWFFVLQPLTSLHEQSVNRLINFQETVKELQSTCNEEKTIVALDASLKQQVHDQAGETLSLDQRMLKVFDCVAQSSLILKSYIPLKMIDKGWYEKKIVEYCIQGDFENILSFFEKLAQSTMFIQCKQIVVNSSEHRMLQVRMVLDVIQLKNVCCSE